MSKRLLPALISIVLLFSTSIPVMAAYSPEDNISESKVKFQQLDNKIMETNLEISNLNLQMDKLSNTIKKNQLDISEIEKQINETKVQMDQLQTEVDSKQKVADIRIRTMYKVSCNNSHLSMILTSKGISDLLFKLEAIQKIISFDKKLLMDLDSKKEGLNKFAAELDLKNQQLLQIKNSNMTSLQQLDTKKMELESLVKQFDLEKKASALIIEENENKLIAYSISVISSQTPTINNLKSAINTLKSLSPQLNTSSVKKKAESYIVEGNNKLVIMIAENSQQNTSADRGDTTYKATFSMVATAYTAHTLTATGLKPVRDPEGLSTIAVDPSVIPLGTKVYIPGYGYAICADTGGAIKGTKIDLFLNSAWECIQWGRRTVVLYVIAYPGEW